MVSLKYIASAVVDLIFRNKSACETALDDICERYS